MIWPFKVKIRREPIPGETWRLSSSDDSPWPRLDQVNYGRIRILDVKGEWVRFEIGNIFRDNRMKMDAFLSCYRPE